MKFSYNWLNSFFEKDLPKPQKLAKKLMMRFFEVEEVKDLKGDTLLDIDVLPNRAADCFSHQGVAREISALYGLKLKEKEDSFKESNNSLSKKVKLDVKDNKLCPRYVLRGFEQVKVKETPKFIKERLETCGLQSINNVVDITNYVMLETGQPLHAFDGKKVEEDKIVVRRSKKGESITSLDDNKYKLDNSTLVIADGKDPIGIAGIKGGRKAEIDKNTTNIYLEAANFDSKIIRKSSKKLKLRTDASSRFEHGLSSNLAEIASKRAAFLLQKYAGAKPLKGAIDIYPKKEKAKVLKLSYKKVNSVLGVNIKKDKVDSILSSLDFNPQREKEKVKVTISPIRKDIQLEEDLIEEIGRLYGYENIDPKKPKAFVSSPNINEKLFWEEKVKNILKELNYSETYNYSFIDQNLKEIFNYEEAVEMDNPVSSDHKFLRPSLRPHLIRNVKNNEERFKDINLFEIGKIFIKQKGNKKTEEQKIVAGVKTDSDFLTVKGDIDFLLRKLAVGKVDFRKNKKDDSFWSIESASIMIREHKIGILGKVSDQILKKMKVKSESYFFELEMEKLIELASEQTQYKRISKFPAAIKDLSVLVPKKVKYEEVLQKAEEEASELLIDVDLFDLYEGEKIPEGKKNLGLRFFFQAKDRTLSKEEINSLLEDIITSLEKNSGWEVRKNK
jgi:phenylalanyl-tRNA synthetase beta chain